MSKPALNIYTYPISFYGTNEDSPTFIVVGENDKIVNKTVLKSSVANLNNLNINAKYTEMPRLEHGFGIDPETAGSINWISRAIALGERIKKSSRKENSNQKIRVNSTLTLFILINLVIDFS